MQWFLIQYGLNDHSMADKSKPMKKAFKNHSLKAFVWSVGG